MKGPSSGAIAVSYGKLPLSFEPNEGQADPQVKFIARGAGYSIFLSPSEATIKLQTVEAAPRSTTIAAGAQTDDAPYRSSAIRMELLGANPNSALQPERQLKGITSYMFGADRSKWIIGLPTYARTRAANVYPGIDLVYYGNQGVLEYDFALAPGADLSSIRLRFKGSAPIVDSAGDLVLPIAEGNKSVVSFKKPVLYQVSRQSGRQEPVEGGFAVAANGEVSFRVGAYDHARTLTIDPVLAFSSYLGGSTGSSTISAMALNGSNEMYVTGRTAATDFPITPGAVETSCPDQLDTCAYRGAFGGYAFVSKIAADGQSLIYSTYLVGDSSHNLQETSSSGTGIAVDGNDEAWATGTTTSSGFPITPDAYQPYCSPYITGQDPSTGQNLEESLCNGRLAEQTNYIVKLNPTGTQLLYGTYLGGSGYDAATAIALDPAGNVYVTGTTNSYYAGPGVGYVNYPVTASAYQSVGQPFSAGVLDVPFLSELSADGHTLVYSTLIAGTCGSVPCFSRAAALAVSGGRAFIAGHTNSANFPTTAGALRATCNVDMTANCAGDSGYVAAFDTTKSGTDSLVFSTYLTGSTPQGATLTDIAALAADPAGNLYVGGYTQFSDFPTTSGVLQPSCNQDPTSHQCSTGFVTKFGPTGSLLWSTFYGSPTVSSPSVSALTLDGRQDVYLATFGNGGAGDIPVRNGFQGYTNSSAVVAELSPDGSQVLFGSFFGGTYTSPFGIAVDASQNIYLAGTGAGNIPVVNAYQSTFDGEAGFFAKIITHTGSSTALLLPLISADLGVPVTLTATVTGESGLSAPTGTISFDSGNTHIGTATLNGSGVATISTSTLAAGSYNVVATYSGDSLYNSSVSSATPLTIVDLYATTSALAISTAGPYTYGEAVTLTATISASGSTIPAGSVTFAEGSLTLGTATLNASGVATLVTTALPAGMGSIMASYSGSSTSTASSSANVPISVAPAPLSVAAASASRFVNTANPTFTGSVSGAVNSDVFTTTYATTAVPSSPAGSYPIVPTISGADIADYTVTLTNGTLTVLPQTVTTTTLSASALSVLTGTSVTFTATVAGVTGAPPATGVVTFTDGSSVLGTASLSSSGVAMYSSTALTIGTHAITASYSGDVPNLGSISPVVNVTITAPPPDFTLNFNPASATIASGNSATTTITLTPTNGFNTATTFSCTGLPLNATCTFSPASLTPNGAAVTSTLTIATGVKVTAAISNPSELPRTGAGTILADLRLGRAIAGSGMLLAILLWPGLTGRRSGGKWLSFAALAVVAAGSMLSVTGCGGGSDSSKTPAGVSTISVMAQAGSATHTGTFTLTVR
ncbi:MAG TPA: Ig-like domain repeat protein [Acidisarcina sp.]